jgi:hypothetical protein
MGTNVRVLLADLLRPQLPPSWVVIPHGVTLENPQHQTVVVRGTTLVRTPGAPRLYRDAGFTVGLVEPGLDLALLEDQLDEDVALLIDALEAIDMPGLVWGDAQRVTFDSKLHGWDIHLTITTEKD